MPTILATMAAIALASLVIARRRRVTTSASEVIDQP
jgi:Tfp pilus assembly protein FimT